MREEVFCEPSMMATEPRSINDLPDEMVLNIISYCEPEDVYCNIAKVSKKWNVLAKDVILWKTLSYECDFFSDFSRISEVRCSTLLGFRTN
jgi:hypothetical protein